MILTMASAESSGSLPLVVIIGATGTGKSELSLDIAEALGHDGQRVELVNADAMQLYRGMDVGTAKLTVDERRGIPHHLFDVLDVTTEASVADYQLRARDAIGGILGRGSVPILVGGSGLYVSSVIYNFSFPKTDPVLRARLEAELVESGPGLLHSRLRDLDPDAATAVGPHNGRRLVRALEVIELTGEPFGGGLPDDAPWHSPTAIIGLTVPRPELVHRLDDRVRRMWQAGLISEVEGLLPLGLEKGITASRAIGYAQAIAQLSGQLSEPEAIEQTAVLTRKYARRQVSWFKRYKQAVWLDADDPSRLDHALGHIRASGQVAQRQ